jgi:hypothetical protein
MLIHTCTTALQLGDKHRITTPVNWKKGDDVIVHPGVSNDEAKKIFPDFTIHDLPTGKASTRVAFVASTVPVLIVCIGIPPYNAPEGVIVVSKGCKVAGCITEDNVCIFAMD